MVIINNNNNKSLKNKTKNADGSGSARCSRTPRLRVNGSVRGYRTNTAYGVPPNNIRSRLFFGVGFTIFRRENHNSSEEEKKKSRRIQP